MKPLLPSLKEKKRYLVFEVITKEKLTDFKQSLIEIKMRMNSFFGQINASKAGVQIIRHDAGSQRVLVRVGHRFVDQLRASLLFIDRLEGKRVIFRSIVVSGILDKADKIMRGV